MMSRWLTCFALVWGCTGDPPEIAVDSGTTIDVLARSCDGRTYDPCTDITGSTDCMQGLSCRFFGTQNITICTAACNAQNPCPPDEQGNPVSCNNMGRCRSNAPNTCDP
jgi:hypothetical protein